MTQVALYAIFLGLRNESAVASQEWAKPVFLVYAALDILFAVMLKSRINTKETVGLKGCFFSSLATQGVRERRMR